MDKVEILDVKISRVSKIETLEYIKNSIDNNKGVQLATVNPEFIIEAQKNENFKNCLNSVDLAVADGVGIKAGAKYLELDRPSNRFLAGLVGLIQGLFLIGPSVVFNRGYLETIPEIITGSDLSYDIAELAADNDFSIYLLGAMPGIAKLAGERLEEKYSGLKIAGSYAGSPDKKDERKIINKINRANPDILLVAYGAPAQDLWIRRNMAILNRPIIAMGVGGTFDFIAGYKNLETEEKIKRAPKIFQKLGLEWLYRLFQEPTKRARRIYNAAILFPWLVWKNSWQTTLDNQPN